MYREMDMQFWRERAERAVSELTEDATGDSLRSDRAGAIGAMMVTIVFATCALSWTTSFAAEPRAGAKTYRIGVLENVGAMSIAPNLDAFRHGMRELGYVEGQHFVLEYRSADGRPERLMDLARELVRLEVDVIVTRGTPAALSARQVTRTTPIVMASSGHPVAEGIVRSLARPGGNVTGFHVMVPAELGGRRLQLLKELVPAASRIGVLWNPADIQTPFLFRETEKAARAMGVQLRNLELQGRPGPASFDQAFESALMDQVDAVVAVEDVLTFTFRSRILDFAAMSRLPTIYGLREFVDAGGLMSYASTRLPPTFSFALRMYFILWGFTQTTRRGRTWTSTTSPTGRDRPS